MSPYDPSSDDRLATALETLMHSSDPMDRLRASRSARRLLQVAQDRLLLEVLDSGTTQTGTAAALGVTQQAVSRAEHRAEARLTALRSHRKYVQRRRSKPSH